MPLTRLILRFVAILGPLAVLAWQCTSLVEFKPRQEYGFVVLLVMELAVLAFLVLVTPRALGTFARHPDLLVPLGVTTTLWGLAGWLESLSIFDALTRPLWARSILGLSLTLSASLLVAIALAVLLAGWTTSLILQAMTRDRVDLLEPLANVSHWFLPTLAALTVGIIGLMALLVVALALGAVAMPLGFILIAIGTLAWNLFTAALLPAMLRRRGPILWMLGEGFGDSLRGLSRWWGVILLQMILIGWVTFCHFSYTTQAGGTTTSHSSTNWGVKGFWTGGYEASSRWYEQVNATTQVPELAPVGTLLALLLGIVAVAVKLTVVQRMDWSAHEVTLAALPASRPRPASGPAVIVLAGIAVTYVILPFAGLFLHKSISEVLFIAEFHQAVARDETAKELGARLAARDDSWEMAERFCTDTDPRVRLALVDYLVGDATPATWQERKFGVFSESHTGFNQRAVPLLNRLLQDSDGDVRRTAIRAVGSRRAAYEFSDTLLRLFHSGDTDDRVAVAESMAHWNAADFLQAFSDRAQPREVRLALFHGAQRYDWVVVAGSSGFFQKTMEKCLDDPDREVRNAAIESLRFADQGPSVWLRILQGNDAEDRRTAFRIWVDALVHEPVLTGETYPLLDQTEGLLFVSGVPAEKPNNNVLAPPQLDGERIALVLHVICTAARENTKLLDQTAPTNLAAALQDRSRGGGPDMTAFQEELHRLQLLLRALTAARDFAAIPRSRNTECSLPMPDNPAGLPHNLRELLVTDVKAPLAWCRAHAHSYPSPFLSINGFVFGVVSPQPRQGQSWTLGQFLEALHMNTDEALSQYIKDRGQR